MAAQDRTTHAAHLLALGRRGVTLIELLIVMTILLALTSVALRMMSPDKEGRRQREAARAINAYLGSARARAMETGRPCGVKFERLSNLPQAAAVISQVETPAPYAGETLDARCKVTAGGGNGGRLLVDVAFTTPSGSPSYINPLMAKTGSLIQFNGQGPWYDVVADSSGSSLQASLYVGQGQVTPRVTPWTSQPSQPIPFAIQPIPVKGLAAPLQLPAGAVIDLAYSGDDSTLIFGAGNTDTTPVVLTFSPNGALDRVWCPGYTGSVLNPIYLLVGKRDHLPPGSAQDGQNNWQMFGNLWIAISPQTGLVTVAEVAAKDNLQNSRIFARKASGKGSQ